MPPSTYSHHRLNIRRCKPGPLWLAITRRSMSYLRLGRGTFDPDSSPEPPSNFHFFLTRNKAIIDCTQGLRTQQRSSSSVPTACTYVFSCSISDLFALTMFLFILYHYLSFLQTIIIICYCRMPLFPFACLLALGLRLRSPFRE